MEWLVHSNIGAETRDFSRGRSAFLLSNSAKKSWLNIKLTSTEKTVGLKIDRSYKENIATEPKNS